MAASHAFSRATLPDSVGGNVQGWGSGGNSKGVTVDGSQ